MDDAFHSQQQKKYQCDHAETGGLVLCQDLGRCDRCDAENPGKSSVSIPPTGHEGKRCHCGEHLAFTVSNTYTHCRRCNTAYQRPNQTCIYPVKAVS